MRPIATMAPRPRPARPVGPPPATLALLSMLSIQLGAAFAKDLFPALGPGGTVALRIGIGALVLWAVNRPRVRGQTRADGGTMVLFGLVIAAMNASFYAALARLPLGITVALELVGPLGVALGASHRRRDLLWAGLAAVGVVLLAPLPVGRTALDPLGVALALLAGVCWGAYILLNVRVGRAYPGSAGVTLAMAVAGLAALPLGLGAVPVLWRHPSLLLAATGVALLATAVPYSLEHAALKRLPAHVFGVLMSVEPAIGVVVGFVVLHEAIDPRETVAIGCVVLASVGSALTHRMSTPSVLL